MNGYLKDFIYGANDGIITTFAVVAVVAGSGLDSKIVLIAGFGNLLADGFSMAASNYLGTKSENEANCPLESSCAQEKVAGPIIAAVVIFSSFVFIGAMPLVPYIIGFKGSPAFNASIFATIASLFIVGASRSKFTHRGIFVSGFEMLIVGGVAAVLAYYVGYYTQMLMG